MKIRGLITAALVFFALAGTLYWSEHRKPADAGSTVSADAPPSILKLDEASVTKLTWKRKDADQVAIEKDSSGNWRITEPESLGADQSTVSGTLSALSNLTSDRLVEEKASDVKRYGLDQSPVDLKITDKGNKSRELQLGDETPTGNAVYAKLADDPRVFTIASYVKSNLDRSLNDLRDKRLLTVNSDKVSRIELLKKKELIEFGRDKNEWQIIKPRPLRADSSQIGDLLQKLVDARMDLSATDSKGAASTFASSAPLATAKVSDQSGTQELQVRKSKDAYYAKSSVVGGVFKIGPEVGQSLDKSLDDFRDKKVFDFGYEDPGTIEWRSGSKVISLIKSGGDWWLNGKKMDGSDVESVLSKLRSLAAKKFPNSGFKATEIEVSVTSDSGKHIERVFIGKSGNGYIAKRENDTSLYEIDPNLVDELQKAVDGIKPASAPAK